jgi:hypothetical protein
MKLEHRLRQALATLLIALFGFALLSPLLAAQSSPDVPSCCLRDGKHRCAMEADAAASSQSGGPAFSSRCCLFPQIHFSLNNSSWLAPPVPHRAMGVSLSASALQYAASFAPRTFMGGTERKRGPPFRFE